MKKSKSEEELEFERQLEWLRVNRPDKWRKIQRLKLERKHKKKHKDIENGKQSD